MNAAGRALIVRLSSLGDIVLVQPAAAALAAAGFHVELWVKPAYASLDGMLPGVAKVRTEPPAVRIDWVLDLQGTRRSRRLAAGVSAGRRSRIRKRGLRRRLLVRPGGRPVFWNAWSGLADDASVVSWTGEVLAAAGVPFTPRPPRVTPPAAAKARVRARHAVLLGGTPYALFAPGARWPNKQWPAAHYAALARRLWREAGLATVVAGGADEVQTLSDVVRDAPGAAHAAGNLTLPELAALAGDAVLAVTNDSGPMHLALAAGTKCLAFFGPTVEAFGFGPLDRERAHVLQVDLPCRPCSLHGGRQCPLGHHRCLANISPEDAWAAAGKLLGIRGGDRSVWPTS